MKLLKLIKLYFQLVMMNVRGRHRLNLHPELLYKCPSLITPTDGLIFILTGAIDKFAFNQLIESGDRLSFFHGNDQDSVASFVNHVDVGRCVFVCVHFWTAMLTKSVKVTELELSSVIIHELVHSDQFASGDMEAIDMNTVKWKGKLHPLETLETAHILDYIGQPWEMEAFKVQAEYVAGKTTFTREKYMDNMVAVMDGSLPQDQAVVELSAAIK